MDKSGKLRSILLVALTVLAFAGLASACVTSNSASGGGYSFTSSGGVVNTIEKNIDTVAANVQSAFSANGVAVTETKKETEGDRRTVKGKRDDLDVTVNLSYNGATSTKVEVTVRKNVVTYDKDFANSIMDGIVKGG